MAAPVKVFVDMMSQPSRAVVLFCKENGIPHKLEVINIVKGQHRSAEFKAVNPAGKVPAIDDGGFHLGESHAILQYLARSRKTPDHWYPEEPKARAHVDEWLHWHHSNLRAGSSRFVFGSFLGPRMGLPSDAAGVELALKTLNASLKFMDNALAGKKFLTGDTITLADISLACEVSQLDLTTFNIAPFANVAAWAARVKSSLRHWEEVHTVLYKVAATVPGKHRPRIAASPASAL